MRLPLAEHDYAAHTAVLPPADPTRHDQDPVPRQVRLGLYRTMLQTVRSFARLTFAYDHRALGRADAVRFLTAVKHRLETP